MSIVLMATISSASLPANTSQGLVSYLQIYIPNSIIFNSTYINQSIGTSSYSIMLMTNGSMIVTNTTSRQYQMVIDANTAAYALAPYVFYKYYPNSTILSSLVTEMQAYRQSAQAPLADCLTETGLAAYACTASTGLSTCITNSCQSVPVCDEVIRSVGAASPFGAGIINFSVNYTAYNGAINSYISIASSINQSNVGTSIPRLQSLASNISGISNKMVQNPLFPLPQSLVSTAGSVCSQYNGFGGPWYCYALGFCQSVSFNTTALSDAQTSLAAIAALPLTNASLKSYGIQSASLAYSFYWPVESQIQAKLLGGFLNSTSKQYIALETNMSFVASRYNNASLDIALSNLVTTYNSIVSAGGSQNFTSASAELSAAMANASVAYKTYGTPYISVYNTAFNNTRDLTLAQLDYNPVPYQIAFLATQQAAVNAQLAGKLNTSSLNTLSSVMAGVTSGASSAQTSLTAATVTKDLYGGIINSLLYSASAPADPANQMSQTYVAAFAFVEGIVVLGIVYYFTYHRLRRKGRIRVQGNVRRAWTILFAIFFIVVLIYTYSEYAIAGAANSFLPVSSFVNALSGSSKAYILVNSSISSNSSISQCVGALKGELTQEGKTLISTTYTGGYSCSINSSVNGPGCFSGILSSGYPAIVVTGMTNTSIGYYGMYGTALFASGGVAMGQSCELAYILK